MSLQERKTGFSKREFPVLVTVDVCDGAYDPGERKPRFKQVMDALGEVRQVLGKMVEVDGLQPITWFVRADGQVAEFTGSMAGLYRGWSSFWDDVKKDGGEVGWHPHLYRRTDQGWQPTDDPKRLASEAEKIWREIVSSGWKPVSSRIGESQCSNELMAFLDSVGIKVDATAIPGRSRDDRWRYFDWEGTPHAPYHPAKADYRRSPIPLGEGDRVEGEEPLRLLEVPFTVVSIRAPYDPQPPLSPPKRYIDLSYQPERIKQGLERFWERWQYIVLVVHPLQASGHEVPPGGLVVGGFDVLKENMRTVLGVLRESGRSPKFLTMSSFRALWLDEQGEEVSASRGSEGGMRKRTKGLRGGARIASVEGEKAVRGTVSGGKSVGESPKSKAPFKAGSQRRRQGPRKRQG